MLAHENYKNNMPYQKYRLDGMANRIGISICIIKITI